MVAGVSGLGEAFSYTPVSRRSDTYRMLVFLSKVVTSYCRRSAAVAGTPFL